MQVVLIAQSYCQNSDNFIPLCFTNLIAFLLAVTVNSVEFVQAEPLHCSHAGEHLSLCLRQVHFILLQSDKQLHLTRRNRDAGAGGKSVVTGRNTWSSQLTFHAQSSIDKAASSHFHCCTCK